MNSIKNLLFQLKSLIERPDYKKEIGKIFKTSDLKKMIDRNEFPILIAGKITLNY